MSAGEARRLLGPDGPLARRLPGYENREGQLDMADAVERALAEGRTLLCEAGTGTGKTLAYLVPAILSGRKIVISTATKALQDQIFVKDLPLLADHLGLQPETALVKGLGNYLCLRRYNELRRSPGSADASVRRSLPLVETWAADTETGDVAELAGLAEGDPLWREVASSSETRIGASCEYFDQCFVTRMKRQAERARILIVNHHLFFADLAVKGSFAGAGVLPAYDAVVFDEAHELEDIATDFFGVRLSRPRLTAMLRDADRAFVGAGLADRVLGKGEGTALTAVVRDAGETLFDRLADLALRAAPSSRAPAPGASHGEVKVTLPRDVWSGDLLAAYHHFDTTLEALAGYADAKGGDEAVKLVAQRAKQTRADAQRIAEPAKNQVTWVEVRSRSVAVGASPVDVGYLFRDRVFDRIGSVVLTSATLTASGDFRFLRSRMGLAEAIAVPVDELSVPSPFDYPTSTLLYTPRDLPETSDPEFVGRAADRIAELVAITGGGAFVLCTSLRVMRAIALALRGRTPRPPLVQGDTPKSMLLGRFRASRDAVLVATMSFWEGVDVPGDALRLVIIDKIPFAVPTDPVVAARCAALEEAGHDPFSSYSVPGAAITLKQGFGRLIRTQTDRGVVAILDRRIRTRGYGTVLLRSLPPAGRTERLEDVAEFWARLQKG